MYWGADEGMCRRCGGHLMGTGGSTLGTTAGQGGKCACSEMTGDISMKSISGAQGREGVINTLINTVIHPSLVRCIM